MAQINFGTGSQGSPPTEEQKDLIRAALDLFSTADHDKLDAIEAGADVTDTTNVVAALTAGDNITIASDGTISSTAAGGGVNDGDDTDVNGLLRGDGATLSAATAAQVRAAADLDTTDSPTFDSLTLTNDITLSDGAQIINTGETVIDSDSLQVNLGTLGPQMRIDTSNGSGFMDLNMSNTPYFRVTQSTGKFSRQSPFGIEAGASGTSSDLYVGRLANGNCGIGVSNNQSNDGTLELADLIASGDINLSDGAQVNIGSAAGTADILGQLTITADGLYDQAVSINGGNITLRNDGAMGCKSLTVSTLRNYIHSSGPRVCNANVIGFVDHTSNAVSYTPNAAFSYGNPTNDVDRNGGAVIALGNGTAQDASGTLKLADIIASGNIDFSGLPTSDPAVAGRLWNDSGTLKISAG